MKTSIRIILFFLVLLLPLSSFAQYVRGDVNRNRTVDIADLSAMINTLLTSGGKYMPICDVNYDRVSNITDVTALINFLLTGTWSSPELEGPQIPDNAQVFTVNGVSFAMITVEGGTFDYVTHLTHPTVEEKTVGDFMIGMTEVTQELWLAVMGENPSFCVWDLRQPVENITYYDCERFMAELNLLTGMDFCFPTEEQWEFAARGGNLSHGYKWAGSDDPDMVAWYLYDKNAYYPYPVGMKMPNELGLYDMSGNVLEWVYNAGSGDIDANTMLLGGSTHLESVYCTVDMFYSCWPNVAPPAGGLRLALPATAK